MSQQRAFTLLELLVVVAIIAILVALALINWQYAHTRAKIGAARADLRTLDTALQAYFADHETYPRGNNYQLSTVFSARALDDKGLIQLSTPVPYLSRGLLNDVFDTTHRAAAEVDLVKVVDKNPERHWYKYCARWRGYVVGTLGPPDNTKNERNRGQARTEWYLLQSSGPQKTRYLLGQNRINPRSPQKFRNSIYDPSNGVFSRGALYRAGGNPVGDDARFAFDTVIAAQ